MYMMNNRDTVKGVGGYDGTNVSDSSVDDLATAISQAGGVTQKEGERGYVLGNSNSATGLYSFAQGNGTYAIGDCSHAEGAAECVNNYLSSDYTAGSQTMDLAYIAYVGNIIIVDNQIAKILSVTGNLSYYTVYLDKPFASDISESTTIKIYPCASGTYSHTEGRSSMASGDYSHAEGSNTYTSGTRSHAEGKGSKAIGDYAHAEGFNTLARNTGEHACGTYNKSTKDVTLFSIGNGYEGQYGEPDTCQNAFEVDINGNVYIKGIGNYDGTNIGGSGVESVQQVIQYLVSVVSGVGATSQQ